MTILAMAQQLSLDIVCGSQEALDTSVTGGYSGDLLSWVMGRATMGAAWVTIMSNPNVAAVASLQGLSCVILAEGVTPDATLCERMKREDIPLLRSPEPAFTLAGKLYNALHA